MMKQLNLIVLGTALILWMSGCERTLETPKQPTIDASLPRVDTLRTLPDITEIGFEWTPVYADRVEGYYLYRMEGSKMRKIATIKDRYISHYVDTKLSPDTSYSYRIATYSAEKRESEPSPIVTVSTTGTIESVPFLKAITGLPNRIKLVWRPHPMERVESYIIERNELKSTQWERVGTIDGRLNAEYIDKDLRDNHLYRYRVKVKTFDGIVSKPSEIVEASTKPLPRGITGLRATTNLPKKILLRWEPTTQSDFAYYKIYRSNNSTLFYSYHGKTKSTEFEDLVSENGKSYYYKVVVVDVDGLESPQPTSPIVGATLGPVAAPSVNTVKHDGRSVFMSWRGDENSVKYTITKEFESGGSTKKQNLTGIFEPNYQDMDTIAGVEYTYHIIAIDKYGIASKPSDAIVITIPKD